MTKKSDAPAIRFKGFSDAWEQRKLGEIGSVSMCRRIFKEQTSETGDIPFYKIGTFGADPDAFISRELFEEYKSKYPYPQKGDILISASGSIGRAVEFAGNNEYFQDSNIVWLNHDERLSNPFLKCFYSVVKWAGIEGSTIKRLYNDNILNTVICMPSVPEQKRIGLFFENLDNLITLHQRECISFTARAGRRILTANKKRNTSSWEQRKFDEVFDCTVPNNTLSRAELSYDEGTVLNVHYGDVLIKYGSVLDVQKDDIPRIPHRCREDFNGALLQDGDVIIADTAEDETTGKACEIGNLQGSAIVSGLHTMVCRPRNRMALGYLGYYLNSNAYHHQLLPLMQGIKVLSLSRSNIQKTSVSYPIAVKEQQLIAYYFSQLDNLITLHQRQLFFIQPRIFL
jgi:restriction endonuclease S subunit